MIDPPPGGLSGREMACGTHVPRPRLEVTPRHTEHRHTPLPAPVVGRRHRHHVHGLTSAAPAAPCRAKSAPLPARGQPETTGAGVSRGIRPVSQSGSPPGAAFPAARGWRCGWSGSSSSSTPISGEFVHDFLVLGGRGSELFVLGILGGLWGRLGRHGTSLSTRRWPYPPRRVLTPSNSAGENAGSIGADPSRGAWRPARGRRGQRAAGPPRRRTSLPRQVTVGTTPSRDDRALEAGPGAVHRSVTGPMSSGARRSPRSSARGGPEGYADRRCHVRIVRSSAAPVTPGRTDPKMARWVPTRSSSARAHGARGGGLELLVGARGSSLIGPPSRRPPWRPRRSARPGGALRRVCHTGPPRWA